MKRRFCGPAFYFLRDRLRTFPRVAYLPDKPLRRPGEEAKMSDISKLKKRMSVIAADGRCIGFVARMAGPDRVRLTSLTAGHGYDHIIPVSWISGVDKYVYLNKASRFVGDNWENAEVAPVRRMASPTADAAGAGRDILRRPQAA